MHKLTLLLAGLILGCAQPAADASGDQNTDAHYSSGPSTRGGTGVYYMGREIAFTMSHLGASWLDRPERVLEERTDLLIETLPFDPESDVADIGAGSGYFALRIAEQLDGGTVYAVDIQPEMLDIIRGRATRAGLDNIELVLAGEKSPQLKPESIDMAFMVDAYHEFRWPREVMLDLKAALRETGKIVLIEYRAEDPTVPIIPVHKMTARQTITEMEAIGLKFLANNDFLPQQHFLIFEKPAAVLNDD